MDAFRPASAAAALRHVFLRDMTLLASIGIHAFEHEATQRIRLNIDLAVVDGRTWFIEINPTGEWGWLDTEARPIAAAIAEMLSC